MPTDTPIRATVADLGAAFQRMIEAFAGLVEPFRRMAAALASIRPVRSIERRVERARRLRIERWIRRRDRRAARRAARRGHWDCG